MFHHTNNFLFIYNHVSFSPCITLLLTGGCIVVYTTKHRLAEQIQAIMTAGILKILEHEICFMSSGSYHVGVDVFFTSEIEISMQVINQ